MDTEVNDTDLAARLRRLDAGSSVAAPDYDYQGMLERHAIRETRARRRLVLARGAALTLMVALLGASFWRLDDHGAPRQLAHEDPMAAPVRVPEPRIVRADTYLAVVALEDHIASLDDAINVARAYS